MFSYFSSFLFFISSVKAQIALRRPQRSKTCSAVVKILSLGLLTGRLKHSKLKLECYASFIKLLVFLSFNSFRYRPQNLLCGIYNQSESVGMHLFSVSEFEIIICRLNILSVVEFDGELESEVKLRFKCPVSPTRYTARIGLCVSDMNHMINYAKHNRI